MVTSSTRSSRGQSSRVWLAAFVCAGLGGVSAILSFWESAHLVQSVLGLLSLPFGAWAQLHSEVTNQRWVAICGAIAGGFGLGLGLGHGGFAV
jgi:hypothetical protein